MPNQVVPATRININSINEAHFGKKLRIVGRVVQFDIESGIFVLVQDDAHILVDLSVTLDGSISCPRNKDQLIVLGELEDPDLISKAELGKINKICQSFPKVKAGVIRALLFEHDEHVNRVLWKNSSQ